MGNNILKKYSPLTCKIALYVPGTNGIDMAADTKAQVNHVSVQMSAMFGGATAQAVMGHWISDVAGHVAEDVTIVYSYTDKKTMKKYLSSVVTLAEKIKSDLHQEAISVEINNKLYFI